MATIAVVGPGAIGLSLAASLIRRGHQVALYGRTPQSGFQHTFEDETSTYPHRVAINPAEAAPAEWILLATKAYQTDAARPWLERLAAGDATLAVVQNGVDHVERVASSSSAPVLPVIISMPCRREPGGRVLQRRKGKMTVPRTEAGHRFASLFDERVFVELTDDWTTKAWTKLLTNATLGLCAVAGAPNGALLEPPLRGSAEALLAEIIAVGRAAGAAFSDERALIEQTLERVGQTPEHRSSITEDRIAGRPTEWDARNHVVVRTGRRFGIPTPLNTALAGILATADAYR